MRINFPVKYVFPLLFGLMYAVFMIMELQGYVKRRGWLFSITPLLMYFALMALLIYGNALLLRYSVLEKRKLWLYIPGILFMIVLYTISRTTIQWYWDNIVWPEEPMRFSSYFLWNFIYAVWFLIIASMLYFTLKWYDQRQQVKNIQINQLQTELKYLRAQINPHFLFNGLNTIYGSIDKENQQARDILVQFSDLLRYNLYEADVDWVDLEKEMIYLENYVALQKARSDSNLQVSLEIIVENKNLKVAPLIFIAFVENAFKFSSRYETRPNTIRVRLQQAGNRIQFECENSYEDDEPLTGGIGLNNAKRRLELLYKDRYTLSIKKEAYTFSVHLTIVL